MIQKLAKWYALQINWLGSAWLGYWALMVMSVNNNALIREYTAQKKFYIMNSFSKCV